MKEEKGHIVKGEDAVALLRSIIVNERRNGCPMASDRLIEPALRRWRGYERRNKKNKNRSFVHRVLDLKNGLLKLFPDYGYDESCLTHLAESFALALTQRGSVVEPQHRKA